MENIVSFFQNINLIDIWNFILNPLDEGIFLYIKLIFIVVSLILIGAAIPLFLVSSWRGYRYERSVSEFVNFRPFDVKKTYTQWLRIIKKLSTGKETDFKLAVIEADTLIEEALEKQGYIGDTFEERLKKVDKIILSNKEQVLGAHKIRNNIVHNPDQELDSDQAKKAINIFEDTLRNLQAF